MKVFSTFSGVGGFEIGIANAIASLNINDPMECVGYSEINKYARSVYEKHFPETPYYGDITKINASELPDFDCLVGGFPCQAFSIAGLRRGFKDTRGTFFFDLARILKEKQPRLFVFENVKGLVNHKKGRTFTTIISTIDELGYDCQWQVLNSKDTNVPQNRERVIIVGHLRGTPRPQVFPIHGETGGVNANGLIQLNNPSHSSRRVFAPLGISPTLKARARQDETSTPLVYVPEATKQGYATARVGQAINLNQPKSKTRRGRVSDISPTIDTGMSIHTLMPDGRVRRFTPKECERLQALPDDWTKYGIDLDSGDEYEISDSQRYKMCGNAVTTNVIQKVFERILASE